MKEEVLLKISPSEKILLELLIGYTNQIYLPPFSIQLDDCSAAESFLCKDKPFGLEWRISKKGEMLLNKIVSLLRNEFYHLPTRRKAIKEYIKDFYRDNCFNDKLFSGDVLLFKRDFETKTLLNCSVYISKQYFGYQLMKYLLEFLQVKIDKVCILYPVNCFEFDKSYLKLKNFLFVKNSDNDTWKSLTEEIKSLYVFDPMDPNKKSSNLFKGFQSEYWLVSLFLGDVDNNLDIFLKEIRLLLVIIICEIAKSNRNILSSNILVPDNRIAIFQNNGKVSNRFVNNLLHSVYTKIKLSDENFSNIYKSIKNIESCDKHEKNKIRLLTDFFIKSLNSNAEDRLINMFIASDSFWGIEGNNKSSMIDGFISSLNNRKNCFEIAQKLYDLRCELLHGGITTLDEWKYYDKYINNFNTEPSLDLINILINKINSYQNR